MRSMQIAIHDREGSFSERWIAYCADHGIPHRVVNAYDSDIISQLRSADALMWHWSHGMPQDLLMARHVIMAAEQMGLTVFPNTATCWHFDDKVAQKYLLEAVGAPLVPTHVFYSPAAALAWIGATTFPKVFKLRRGAGSTNVRLAGTADEARRLVCQAFGKGFVATRGYLQDAGTRLNQAVAKRDLVARLKRLPSSLARIRRSRRQMVREKEYVYFQDFVGYSQHDTRVTVIGDRAFAFTRNVRKGDFRASGSGSIDYDLGRVDTTCVRIAFDVTRRLGAQSLAFDFLAGAEGPCITEVSYGYQAKAVHDCAGHWDGSLAWHEGHVWPQDAIMADLVDVLSSKDAPGSGA